jgi:hypothetical protein
MAERNLRKIHTALDSCGFFLSLACGIHCLIMPLLLIALPFMGLDFILDEGAERYFVIGTLVLAAFSLFWGYFRHKKLRIVIAYLLGASLIFVATFVFAHDHGQRPQDHPLSLSFLLVGAFLLCWSHWVNRKFCTCGHSH